MSTFKKILVAGTIVSGRATRRVGGVFFRIIVTPSCSMSTLRVLKRGGGHVVLIHGRTGLPEGRFHSLLGNMLIRSESLGVRAATSLGAMASGTPAPRRMRSVLFTGGVMGGDGSGTVILTGKGRLLTDNIKRASHISTLGRTVRGTGSFNFSLRNTIVTSSTFFPFPSYIRVTSGRNIATIVRPNNSIGSRLAFSCYGRRNVTVIAANVHRFGRWLGAYYVPSGPL